MKKLILLLAAICFIHTVNFAQVKFGVKGGLNFANVTKASSINNSSSVGFNAGVFIAPDPKKKVISYRSEIIYSRQGYDFKTNQKTGSVKMDYVLLPQLMMINITKYVSLQIGGQVAFLLNAKADSTSSAPSTGNAQADKIMDLYNRFDYGATGGVEFHPYKGILVGARMNVSFGDIYKDPAAMASRPSFIPAVNIRNNVVQVFLGYKF